MCHPRLPLVAALDAERPAVHIWDHSSGQLSEIGTVGADLPGYDDAPSWERWKRTPTAAWHPEQPLLVVAGEEGAVRWTPAGCSVLEPAVGYRNLAFSPDGRTLWASPSSGGDERSDALDLATGAVRPGLWWDTGVAEHPGGGLVLTLQSDQGATHGLFARVDDETAPAPMRVLRRALILDVDGYETPVFSADGRHFAIRGNAYENTLEVFAFPSLHRVLATTLGEPSPGYPYPPEWLEQMHAWSRHNIAFGARPDVLWIGTPTGTLIELNIDSQQAVEHDVLTGSRVTALAATATGELLVAGREGDLVLLSVPGGDPAKGSEALVTAFLDATSDVPEDCDLEEHLVITDGDRAWEPDDLASVTTATGADPSWLQLRAAINNVFEQDT